MDFDQARPTGGRDTSERHVAAAAYGDTVCGSTPAGRSSVLSVFVRLPSTAPSGAAEGPYLSVYLFRSTWHFARRQVPVWLIDAHPRGTLPPPVAGLKPGCDFFILFFITALQFITSGVILIGLLFFKQRGNLLLWKLLPMP